MGKRPIVRRRGRSPLFEAPTHRRVAPAKYPEPSVRGKGVVVALHHDPGRGTPLAEILLEDNTRYFTIPSEGMYVGQEIEIGEGAKLDIGSTLPLREIPEGVMVYNVERRPGDGGSLFRASGNYATVVGRTEEKIILKTTRGTQMTLHPNCRGSIGVAAGGGRTEKPFLKAGKRRALMYSRGRLYPRVRGVAMDAVYHPFGGGRHEHTGKPTTVSRKAPPGRKVGLISARRTGRGGKKRVSKREK
ncbi:50S ribosomal protein L2 [Candidatus Bathyarchaeota archaeon ex4484_205]|nr:MAG: 50S ribosomal protein L2 [Candidatus Bathyarchaeota archaeon ex4484_205]RLG69413.1 MAG: 50S ribosomal protein L2 [archaeon]